VPERYQNREFFRYNAQNLLLRTNAEEFAKIGDTMGERLKAARGPVRVLIPLEGFSEHSKRRAQDLAGNDRGAWKRPEEYQVFTQALRTHLDGGSIKELPLHINDAAFGDACVDAFVEITKDSPPR
jgi:uncharacterized protein (UPF0261 family)